MSHPTRTAQGGGQLEAFRTTGSSPGETPRPSIHLVGPGGVGRNLLDRLTETQLRLIGVSDRLGTLYDPHGLDPTHVREIKERSGGLEEGATGNAAYRPTNDEPGSTDDLGEAVEAVRADILVDATSTVPGREEWPSSLERVLERGGTLVLASKDALARRAPRWLAEELEDRVGIHAVLGGTGRLLQQEIGELREKAVSAALAGNAATTTIIGTVEEGGSIAEGIEVADSRGLLETDPELDLTGYDASVKLAIVAGALLGRSFDPAELPSPDVRALDPGEVRSRRAEGFTTRLIGRIRDGGALSLAYEAVERSSPLAVPPNRVAYEYTLSDGRRRIHLGEGLGAEATAAALFEDLDRVARAFAPTTSSAAQSTGASAGAHSGAREPSLELPGGHR